MTKNNIYSPKENYKQVEEVSYLEEKETITPEEQAKIIDKLVKNEIPSYEEFMKNYQEDEGVSDNYYYEIDSHGDIRVVKCYGPGFWDDLGEGLWEVGKFTTKVVVSGAAAGAVISTGGVAAPILGGTLWATGEWAKDALEGQEGGGAEFTRFVADTMSMTGSGSVFGSALGTSSKSLASKASKSAYDAGIRTAGTNGSKVLLDAWIYTKMAQEGYSLGGKGKNAMEAFCHYYHGKHKSNGLSYDSECPICNGHFDNFFWL